jgi:hypothetical protein
MTVEVVRPDAPPPFVRLVRSESEQGTIELHPVGGYKSSDGSTLTSVSMRVSNASSSAVMFNVSLRELEMMVALARKDFDADEFALAKGHVGDADE